MNPAHENPAGGNSAHQDSADLNAPDPNAPAPNAPDSNPEDLNPADLNPEDLNSEDLSPAEQHLGHLLASLPLYDESASKRLHDRLVDNASRIGDLDISYRTMDTPVGELLLATTGEGLVRVAYDSEGHDAVLADLASTVSPRILEAPDRLDEASSQLDEYFAGHRTTFDLPLDFRLSHGFRRAVLAHLPEIGYGRTESYAEVAAAAGSARAVRAVGTACARNPLPVVVPCHRVVRSDGSTGGYVGGSEAKRTLLELEGAA